MILLFLFIAMPAQALVSPVLSAGTVTETTVQLNWTDGGDEQNYKLYQDSVLLTTLGKNVLTFTVTNLTPNTTYNFRVDAKKGNQTYPSNTLPVTTQLPPPMC
jgi:chitodextrinase